MNAEVDINGAPTSRLGACAKADFVWLPEGTQYQRLVRFVETKPYPEGCVDWPGACSRVGYGKIRIGDKHTHAHRVAYELAYGPVSDLHVLHRCLGNRKCCNPGHLYSDTNADNARDRDQDGTTARGDRSGARLHPEKRPWGDRNGSRLHPESRPRGDSSPSRLHPERMARGDRSGARLHPESRPHGDKHYARTRPEALSKGEQHYSAKLTEVLVQELRVRYAAGDNISLLAREHGVSRPAMSSAITGETWKHVAGATPLLSGYRRRLPCPREHESMPTKITSLILDGKPYVVSLPAFPLTPGRVCYLRQGAAGALLRRHEPGTMKLRITGCVQDASLCADPATGTILAESVLSPWRVRVVVPRETGRSYREFDVQAQDRVDAHAAGRLQALAAEPHLFDGAVGSVKITALPKWTTQ